MPTIETINDYFILIQSGQMTAEQATADCIARGMTYALEYFSPQTDDDMPYWDMLQTAAYRAWKHRPVAEPKPRSAAQHVICDCGCITPVALVMSTTRGTSCPDCYDDMSE